MDMNTLKKIHAIALFLIIALLAVQPVLAEIPKSVPAVTEKMSIAYRGGGGYYIGNTITFDGMNKAGNVTLLRLSGPGLPAAGVPLTDVNGAPGSGNTVDVNPDGTWRYIWYTSNIKGIDQLQTVRYTVSAVDLANPENIAATSVYMKKPDFSVIANPPVIKPGEYVQLFGNAENGVSSVKIDVTDSTGKIIRTYESPVSASGYFNYGFHFDMPVGQYNIIITNPLTKKTSQSILTVAIPPKENVTSTLSVTPVPQITISLSATSGAITESPNTAPSSAPQVPAASPSALPVYLFAIIGILAVVCIILVFLVTRRKNP